MAICSQPPVKSGTAPQSSLVFKGTLSLQSTIEKFGRQMPKLAEFDELVSQGPSKQPHPELVAKKTALPARSGTILAHPAENSAFPRFLEFTDKQTGRKICIDTKQYANQRGIALVLMPGAYTFQFDGNRMLIFPSTDPIVIPYFPQFSGWYPYHKDTGVPVVSGGIVDQFGSRPDRFLQRTPDAWIGMPARSINEGNYEEKYVYAFARPSLPQAVFIWEPQLIQKPEGSNGEERKVPRRRIVQIPASAPVQAKDGPKPEPKEKPRSYSEIAREYQIEMARYYMDPRTCRPPKPIPSYPEYLELLKQGKVI